MITPSSDNKRLHADLKEEEEEELRIASRWSANCPPECMPRPWAWQRMAAFGCRFDGLAIASRGGNSGGGPITIAATASIIIIVSLACSSPFGPSS